MSGRKTLDIDFITLRKIYAFNSTNNAKIPKDYVLSMTSTGEAIWANPLSNISSYGGVISITAGSNVTITGTPQNPIINAAGGGGSLPSGTNYSDYLFWNNLTSDWDVGSTKVHLGAHAGEAAQGFGTVAIGYYAGNSNQGGSTVAIGKGAGAYGQTSNAIAFGENAGNSNQGRYAIALGTNTGNIGQQESGIAIGTGAGYSNQGIFAIALGVNAGNRDQSGETIAIGNAAGYSNQSIYAVALGTSAGYSNQQMEAIAIGGNAGQWDQSGEAIAIGANAGTNGQGGYAIAIGNYAGYSLQNDNTVAIGNAAGNDGQKMFAVALGASAGYSNQGTLSIAIGANAATSNQPDNNITLNAAGAPLNPSTTGFFVNPVRPMPIDSNNMVFYNSGTSEFIYDASNTITFAGQDVIFSGNLIPSQSNVWNLGSSNMPWSELWVSSSTIHVGPTATIKADICDNIVISNGLTLSHPIETDIINPFAFSASAFNNSAFCSAYGDNKWIAVGASSPYSVAIMSVDNGVTWTDTSCSISVVGRGIAYGDNKWVAVGGQFPPGAPQTTIQYSYDGNTWYDASSSPLCRTGFGVAYGGGKWVMTGYVDSSLNILASIQYSYDGINWNTIQSGGEEGALNVAYGDGIWVAVGSTSVGSTIQYSNDGINWSNTLNSFTSIAYSVAYGTVGGSGRWVAVGDTGVKYSDDAITWTDVPGVFYNTSYGGYSITYYNGLWAAIGESSFNVSVMKTSPDGISWTTVNNFLPFSNNIVSEGTPRWYNIAHGNNTWIACGPGTGTNTDTIEYSISPPIINNSAVTMNVDIGNKLVVDASSVIFNCGITADSFTLNSVTPRWSIDVKDAEASGNVGNNLAITSYANDGTPLDIPISIVRATGEVDIHTKAVIGGVSFVLASGDVSGESAYAGLVRLSATGTDTLQVQTQEAIGAVGNQLQTPYTVQKTVVDLSGVSHDVYQIACDNAAGFLAGCTYIQGGVMGSSTSATPYDGNGPIISPVQLLSLGGSVLINAVLPVNMYKSARMLINLSISNHNTDGVDTSKLRFGIFFNNGGPVIPAQVHTVGWSMITPPNATVLWSGSYVAVAGTDYTQGASYTDMTIIAYADSSYSTSRIDEWSLNWAASTVL